MNFKDLKEFVAQNPNLPDGTELTTLGHYGEMDADIDELSVRIVPSRLFSGLNQQVIVVSGPAPSYPEPD
jgi:hypothetical protein